MIFCAVSADVIIPPVVPVVNPVITVTQGCQWLVCICGFLYLFVFVHYDSSSSTSSTCDQSCFKSMCPMALII